MELEVKYREIRSRLTTSRDFSIHSLQVSRDLFDFEGNRQIPKAFDVWTVLAGLPMPIELTGRFREIIDRILTFLPDKTRFYRVIPENYHWELFILQRTDEKVSPSLLERTPEILREVFRDTRPITMTYRGFLVTEDGTVIVRGYGDFDSLRERLRERLPFASPRQSRLGHVSLGRILDPIGETAFDRLKRLIIASSGEIYGEITIDRAKFVHESRWYMEERQVIAEIPFGGEAGKDAIIA